MSKNAFHCSYVLSTLSPPPGPSLSYPTLMHLQISTKSSQLIFPFEGRHRSILNYSVITDSQQFSINLYLNKNGENIVESKFFRLFGRNLQAPFRKVKSHRHGLSFCRLINYVFSRTVSSYMCCIE